MAGQAGMMDQAKVMEVLRQVEWALTANEEFCPCCYWLKTAGHKDNCKLAALLAEGDDLPTVNLTPEDASEALTVGPAPKIVSKLMVADLLKLFNLFGVPEDVELYGDPELYACDPLDPNRHFVIQRVRLAKGEAGEGDTSE